MGQLFGNVLSVSPHRVPTRVAPVFSLCLLLILLYFLTTILFPPSSLSVWFSHWEQSWPMGAELIYCSSVPPTHNQTHTYHNGTEAHSMNAVRHFSGKRWATFYSPQIWHQQQIKETNPLQPSLVNQWVYVGFRVSEKSVWAWSSLHHWWQRCWSPLHWMQPQQLSKDASLCCCLCNLRKGTWGWVL